MPDLLDLLKFDFIKGGLNDWLRRQQFRRGALTKAAAGIPSSRGVVSARAPHVVEFPVRGREKELARLRGDFSANVIVVVDGLAGIGKTTLAEKFAEALDTKWRSVWVDCRTGMSLESLTGALAIHLGAADSEFAKILQAQVVSNPERGVDAFIGALDRDADRPLALFLDDFHEAQDDEVIAHDLLVECRKQLRNARVVILTRDATSARDALYDAGDVRIKPKTVEEPLGGLSEDPALEMLRDSGVTQDEATLRRLASKTRGHPIALKLGAGLLLSGMGIGDLERLPLFQLSGDEVHSLKRILDETDARLPRVARGLIERLTVFDEPFKLEEAKPVAGYAIVALDDLRARFLLGESEGWLELHPLVREYFSSVSPAWTSSTERRNCHRRAGHVYLERANALEDERAKIEPLLKAYDHFKTAEAAQEMLTAFNSVFATLLLVGRWDEAFGRSQEAVAASRQIRDQRQRLGPLYAWGAICYRRGDWKEAERSWKGHLKIASRLKDQRSMAQTYNNLGLVYADKGEWDKAIEFYQNALGTLEKVGDIHGMAQTYNNLGLVYADKGEWDKAIEFYQKSLETKEKVGDIVGVSATCWNMGSLFEERGDLSKAIEMIEKAVAIKEKVGHLLLAEQRKHLDELKSKRTEL